MTLTRQEKEVLLEEYVEQAQNSSAMIFVGYSGLTVGDAEVLRRALRPLEGRFRVIKSSLFDLALKRSGLPAPQFSGTQAVVFCPEDVAPVAKALADFMKHHESLTLHAGIMDGRLLDEAEVKALASLPSKDEARSQLIATIEGPLTNIVRIVQAPLREIAQVLQAYAEKSAEAA